MKRLLGLLALFSLLAGCASGLIDPNGYDETGTASYYGARHHGKKTASGEGSADEIIEKRGLKQVTDSGAISAVLDEMLAANAEQVEQYRAADEAKRGKMFGFFVGQAMKASKGKANPQQVNELLKSKLEG